MNICWHDSETLWTLLYMRFSDIIVVKRRHVGGILHDNETELKCENLNVFYSDSVLRSVCNSTHTHNSFHAYVSFRRYTSALSIPPTWRRLRLWTERHHCVLKPGWDERATSGMGCFSVHSRLRCFYTVACYVVCGCMLLRL